MNDGPLAADLRCLNRNGPTYGNIIGNDTPVTHRYQHVPELTKNAPARNFRTSRYLKTTSQIGNAKIHTGSTLIISLGVRTYLK